MCVFDRRTLPGYCLLRNSKRMTGGSRQSSLSNGRRGNLGQVHETPFARKDLQIEDDSEINVALGGGTRRAPVYTDRLG